MAGGFRARSRENEHKRAQLDPEQYEKWREAKRNADELALLERLAQEDARRAAARKEAERAQSTTKPKAKRKRKRDMTADELAEYRHRQSAKRYNSRIAHVATRHDLSDGWEKFVACNEETSGAGIDNTDVEGKGTSVRAQSGGRVQSNRSKY